jgi:hypothetical protein
VTAHPSLTFRKQLGCDGSANDLQWRIFVDLASYLRRIGYDATPAADFGTLLQLVTSR